MLNPDIDAALDALLTTGVPADATSPAVVTDDLKVVASTGKPEVESGAAASIPEVAASEEAKAKRDASIPPKDGIAPEPEPWDVKIPRRGGKETLNLDLRKPEDRQRLRAIAGQGLHAATTLATAKAQKAEFDKLEAEFKTRIADAESRWRQPAAAVAAVRKPPDDGDEFGFPADEPHSSKEIAELKKELATLRQDWSEFGSGIQESMDKHAAARAAEAVEVGRQAAATEFAKTFEKYPGLRNDEHLQKMLVEIAIESKQPLLEAAAYYAALNPAVGSYMLGGPAVVPHRKPVAPAVVGAGGGSGARVEKRAPRTDAEIDEALSDLLASKA